MEVKVHKEIRDFKEQIFFGFTIKQFIYTVFAVAAAVLAFMAFRNVHIELASWAAMVAAAPFAVMGFMKYKGMSAERLIYVLYMSFRMKKQLHYEPVNTYVELLKTEKKGRSKREYSKRSKKSK